MLGLAVYIVSGFEDLFDEGIVFEEVHSPFVKGVVDFKDHCFQSLALIVQIPERDGIKRVSQELRRGHKIAIRVFLDIFTL